MRMPKLVEDLCQKVLDQRKLMAQSSSRYKKYKNYSKNLVARYEKTTGTKIYSKEGLDCVLNSFYDAYEDGWISKEQFCYVRRIAADIEDVADYGNIGDGKIAKLPPWGHRRNPLTRPVSDDVKNDTNNIIGLALSVLKEMERLEYSSVTINYYRTVALPRLVWFFMDQGTTEYSDELIDSYFELLKGCSSTMERSRWSYQRTASLHIKCIHHKGGLYERVFQGSRSRALHGFFAPLIKEFEEWGREEKSYKQSTIEHDRHYVNIFLEYLRDEGCDDMRLLTKEHVRNARKRMCSGRDSDYVSRMLTSVRSFAAFAEDRHPEWPAFAKWIGRNPKTRRKQPIEGYSNEQAKAIIDSVDTSTKVGKRNYAMLLLARNTGLRAIDIVNLRIGNIDWRNKTIKIEQEKTRRPLLLPLDTETGEAIATYILKARRNSDCDTVFLTAQGPVAPMDTSALYAVVVKYAKPICGPNFKGRHGIHSFRRGLGSSLVEAEVPAADIAEIFGHSSEASTDPYMAIATERLRICVAGLEDAPLAKGAGYAE